MARLAGTVAIVTGGAGGIGAAIARRFGREGAAVVVADLHEAPAEAVADELRGKGCRALARGVDVRDEEGIRSLTDAAVAELGGLDIMVSNAGIGEDAVPIEEKSADDWHRILETNLTSAFYGVKHAARVMKAAGRGGVIINMASILGVVGFRGAPAYTAAKHGMLGLTKAAALELAPFRIRVVAVAPAFIRTPLVTSEEQVLPLHPLGRLGEPEEVADLTTFLASAEAGFITGAHYLIDGGYTAQ